MRRRAILAALSAALAACSGGGSDADADGAITGQEAMTEAGQDSPVTMEPGAWEQSVTFSELEMPGAPDALQQMMRQSMQATVTSQACLGPDEVARPDAGFFAGEGNGDCAYEEFERTGNHLKLRMTCGAGETTNTIAMEGDLGANQYTFDVATTVNGGPQGAMAMKGTISAKRVGECPG